MVVFFLSQNYSTTKIASSYEILLPKEKEPLPEFKIISELYLLAYLCPIVRLFFFVLLDLR